MKKEELEPHIAISLAAGLGTLADQLSTKIGLTYPELKEMNPMFDAVKEFVFASGGGEIIYALGRLLGQSNELSTALALVPSGVVWGNVLVNTAWIIWVNRKYYPWKECPFLYPEEEKTK